ncbi:MAG: hypothetical protein JSV67_02285 [Thermoplasmatales archaeon]|nr:MAG: hypothetical protein JSV67_02285 [Thermoplasmatales archaeon]
MKNEHEIVKILHEEEKLGQFQSKIQNTYKKLKIPNISLDKKSNPKSYMLLNTKIVTTEDIESGNIEKLRLIKGEVKAVTLLTDKTYIIKHKGENGITRVEEEIKKMGLPFEYNAIKSPSTFYPLSIRVASLLATKKVFGWDDNQMKEMGRMAPKNSVFTKLLLRYLISLKKMAKEIPRHWKRHYTIGLMDPGELHEDDKHLIIRLRDFNTHPIMCTYLSGYFIGTVELLSDFINLTIEEVKCMHKGDDYHKFIIRWE